MRIGIAGIGGRVGSLVASLVSDTGHVLSGGTGRADAPDKLAALASRSDVIIDFSHASAVAPHAASLSAAGTPWVLGTTGLDRAAQRAVEAAAGSIGIVQSANFAPGVALLLEVARHLASRLPEQEYDAEILEMHHRLKRDAPSGTARAIGEAVAQGRARDLDAVAVMSREGETGSRPHGAIGFATLRGGAIVGEHVLSFIGPSERITLSHDALDRRIFAEGALRAAVWLQRRPPGLYAMRDVLDLPRA